MNVALVLVVASGVLFVLGLARMAWMGWRIVRGNEELVPGGSLGRQLVGRDGTGRRRRFLTPWSRSRPAPKP